jgi:GAF domain-containing protein
MLPQFLACRSGASSVASAQEAFLLRIDDLMTDPQNQTVPPGPEPHWVVELQGLLLSTEGLDAFLRELAVVTVRALPAAVACGVTLQPDGRPRTVSASGELAMQVDEIQYSVNAGPCLDAMRTGDVHYVRDFGAETRWPQFTTAALGYGVRGCLSTPLQILNGSAGALNVYAATVDAFDTAARDQALAFAEYAAGAVALALRMARQAEVSEDLRTTLASRSIIDQAMGVIMGQQRCTAQEAFAVLRRASQQRNVKIAAIAAGVVEGTTGRPPQPGRFTARGDALSDN